MSNQQAQIEIQKQFRERQDKFVYYLIALCVAAIGFSVSQTIGQHLNCLHCFLGAAVICWVVSIFCGFQFVQIVLKGLHANDKYFETIAGRGIDITGVSQKTVDEAASIVLREKRDKYSKRTERNFMWQQYLFYTGLVLFLVWHIIQMYQN